MAESGHFKPWFSSKKQVAVHSGWELILKNKAKIWGKTVDRV